jgi:hypothetical protein
MRRFFAQAVIGSFLLLGGVAANAQYGDPRYDRGRDSRYDRDDRDDRGGFLDRLRYDLDRAERNSYASCGDHRRFNRLRSDLNDFQGKWARGNYSRHELDEVIGSLQRVVNDNRLDYRDRDILQNDLNRMRGFRSQHDGWR